MTRHPFLDAAVAAAYEAFKPAQRDRLLAVRQIVLATAEGSSAIGALHESLKWGEPAYRPSRNRVGTTVRLGVSAKSPQACAVFVNCKTSLLSTFRDLYTDLFDFEGERALIIPSGAALPTEAISHCVSLALTYHIRTKVGA